MGATSAQLPIFQETIVDGASDVATRGVRKIFAGGGFANGGFGEGGDKAAPIAVGGKGGAPGEASGRHWRGVIL